MTMKKEPTVFMLTTVDNPYNPFREWDRWLMEDLRLGHDTCGLLARLVSTPDDIDVEAELRAMEDVVRNNWSGVHIMVTDREWSELIKLPVD